MSNLSSFLRAANKVAYSNATSGLTATFVQGAIDELDSHIDNIVTLSGVALDATHLGTFTGATIPDSSTIKDALQALETKLENVSARTNSLIGLSGVAANATDLGTFTGTTISDNTTVKNALQQLEVYGENTRSLVEKFEWLNSVASVSVTTPPGSPATGDRYLIGLDTAAAVATGAWAGKDGQIAEWNGTSWIFTDATLGTFTSADNQQDRLYSKDSATTWSAKYFEATTASTGLTKVGFDIRLASSSAGDGLAFTAGVLSVNVDDSTIEINTDTLRVKDLGITTAKLAATSVTAAKLGSDVAGTGLTGGNGSAIAIDFGLSGSKAISATDLASSSNGKGASLIGIEDAASNYTSTNVEGALVEVADRLTVLEGAGTSAWTVKTANYTAVNKDKILANSTGGSFTVTLPASPTVGMEVYVRDAFRTTETNAVIIGRNGSSIAGSASDLTLDVNGCEVKMVFAGGSQGWSVASC